MQTRSRNVFTLSFLACTAISTAALAQPADEPAVPETDGQLPPIATPEPSPPAQATAPAATAAPARPAPPPREPDDDGPAGRERALTRPVEEKFLHGFRLGYMYLAQGKDPDPQHPDRTVLESLGLRSPSSFLIGYELIYRLVGHSWLNVLLVGNFMIAGIEQSRFLPSVNFLIGWEFHKELQLGVGVDLTPDREKASHMIGAIGWTPQVGSFWVPVHFFVVPDVDGNHRLGATVGVTW